MCKKTGLNRFKPAGVDEILILLSTWITALSPYDINFVSRNCKRNDFNRADVGEYKISFIASKGSILELYFSSSLQQRSTYTFDIAFVTVIVLKRESYKVLIPEQTNAVLWVRRLRFQDSA